MVELSRFMPFILPPSATQAGVMLPVRLLLASDKKMVSFAHCTFVQEQGIATCAAGLACRLALWVVCPELVEHAVLRRWARCLSLDTKLSRTSQRWQVQNRNKLCKGNGHSVQPEACKGGAHCGVAPPKPALAGHDLLNVAERRRKVKEQLAV